MGAVGFRRLGRAVVITLAALVAHQPAFPAETIYVVVSAQSPVRAMTQKDVLALYTGRTRTLPNGDAAQPLDQHREGAARAAFYQAIAGMDLARINSYWARLHFTGQVQPPLTVGGDDAVIARVRADPNALGYVLHEPKDPAVRIVLRLP